MRNSASGTHAHTPNTLHTVIDKQLVDAALSAVTKGHDAHYLASSCYADLETLFRAIAAVSGEHSQAAKLAKIGVYLASDWGNLADCEREELAGHVNAFRDALGLPAISSEWGAK